MVLGSMGHKDAFQRTTHHFLEIWSCPLTSFDLFAKQISRGGHRHLQIGRMLDIDLISEPPHAPSPQMYVHKVWESVWPEGQEAIHC
jgi:hypothetical protein